MKFGAIIVLWSGVCLAFEHERMVSVIDTHCAGEPARIVTGGVLNIPGGDMASKRAYMMSERDGLRKMLMLEPRGHNDMFGSYLTEPVTEGSDFGIVFMDAGGYLNMCGHNTIAAVTTVVTTGMVDVKQPHTVVTLDTPAGLVRVEAEVSGDHNQVGEVGFLNVPSFVYQQDIEADIPQVGHLKFDIAFGGSFFVIVSTDDNEAINIPIEPENASEFARLGLLIRDYVNDHYRPSHPILEHINEVDLVEFYTTKTETADARNVVVFGNGQVDRSPCGTGTSAKVALMHAKGQLAIGKDFIYESIVRASFRARVNETTTIEGQNASFPGVIPYVAGRAYITGFNTYVVDPQDPFKEGFTLQ